MRSAAVKVLIAVAAVGLLAAGASGCSRETEHEVLTFFFTGVPPLDGEGPDDGQVLAERTAEAHAQRARRIRAEKDRQRRLQQLKTAKWSHGPYAAGECGRCHAVGASQVFRSGQEGQRSAVPSLGSVASRLSAAPEKLCVGCHTAKTADAARDMGLQIHSPVAKGKCVICHSPHQSPRRYMLRQKDNVALCTECHDRAKLQRSAVHSGRPETLDCTGCHNAHMGRTRRLLKSKFNELERRWGDDT